MREERKKIETPEIPSFIVLSIESCFSAMP